MSVLIRMALKDFFLKSYFEKKSADDNKSMKITQHAELRVSVDDPIIYFSSLISRRIGNMVMKGAL